MRKMAEEEVNNPFFSACGARNEKVSLLEFMF